MSSSQLDDKALARLVIQERFPDPAIAVAIILAESGGDALAKRSDGNTPPSTDRGLWQINSHWHPEVDDACAYDPVCSTKAAKEMSHGGTDFSAWSAFKRGRHTQFLDRARAAVQAVGEPARTVPVKSKLGIYAINSGDLPVDWFAVAQPRVAVSMDHNPDYWRAVKQASPNTRIMGRFYVEQENQHFDSPQANAEALFNGMRECAEDMRGIYDLWMGYNETAVFNPDQARNLSAFYVRWGDLMHGAGFKVAAYSFSEGHPEPGLWSYLVDGLRHCDALCLHEYDAPEMWRTQTWRCLRYRQVINALPPDLRQIPIWIGETGIDGGVSGVDIPQQGWKRFGDQAHYLASLKWYDGELVKDDQVVGAAIFAAKWNMGSGTFDMGDAMMIRDYIASSGLVVPPTQATYTVQAGDTLYQIARRFGVSVAAIVQTNNIPDPSKIKTGQVLIIPPPSAVRAAARASTRRLSPPKKRLAQKTSKRKAAKTDKRAAPTARKRAVRKTTTQRARGVR